MKKNKIKIITSVITTVLLILLIYTIINSATLEVKFSQQIQDYGLPALFFSSLIFDLVPQFLSPAMVLAAAILTGISFQLAILTTILGSTLGAIIGFMLGKKYMFKAVNILTSKKSSKELTELTNKYGKIIIPIAAISPLPYLPVLFGAINLTKRNFLFYGIIPRAIGIIIYGYAFSLV